MTFDAFKNKGLSGLANLGNTCFINSCLQILSHTYELNLFLDIETYRKKLNNNYDSALLIEWDNLRNILWKENCIVAPHKFINTIQKLAKVKKNELFSGYSQNDLSEFFVFVIDCFHNALKREVEITINGQPTNETDEIALLCFQMIKKMYSKEFSEIWSLFNGIQVCQILSLQDEKEEKEKVLSNHTEPFFMINLSIPIHNKTPSIYDCFDLYVEGEKMEGENAWFNEKTGQKEDVQRKISFWSFPSVLAIDFKRFVDIHRKNQILIDFPLDDLDLSKYVIGYKKKSYVYECYGICNHMGGILGGHYTCFVKNANGKWYHYNDTNVQEVKHLENLITPRAYCLFYRKKVMQ